MFTQKLKLKSASSPSGLPNQDADANVLDYNSGFNSPGSLAFSAPTFSINENGVAVAAVTVTRTGGSSGIVGATISLSDGTAKQMFGDYKSSPIMVTFADGDTASKIITIPIVDDAKDEANETLNLRLGNLTGGATLGSQNTATLTILDNDPLPTVNLSQAAISRSEGDSGVTALTFTVNFSHRTSRTVRVPYTINNGTAIAGSDYIDNDGVLTFAAGQTSKTITVLVNGDTTAEANETFTVNLGTPTNALLGTTSQSTATIVNDDTPGSLAFSAPTFSINENGVAVAAVTVTRTGGSSGNVGATISLSDGTATKSFNDYNGDPINVMFGDGDTSPKIITIPVVDDPTNEINETINLSLENPIGGANLGSQNTATLTILDNDPLPTVNLSQAAVSHKEGDSGTTALTFTVNFSHRTSQTVSVPYTINNGTAIAGSDYIGNNGVLTFTAGQTSKTITVLVNGDKTVENNETFSVKLGTPTNATLGSTNQVTATIVNDDVSQLNLGKTVYVAANGSDSNLGTIDQPFKTIQGAVNRMVDGAGGTILVRGGTYENTSVWIGTNRDGSANSPLVIKNYGDEKVYLKGNIGKDIIMVGGEYVTIQGFDISNGKTGIIGVKAQNLKVLNNTVHDVSGHGIGIYGNTFGGTSNILLDGNTVYHAALGNKTRTSYSWASGITISNGKYATVTNNHVYNNYGEGITATLSDNVRAANNTFHDNFSVQMYLDNATHSVFENNLIYTTGNSNFFNQINNKWQAAVGIEMNNERYSVSNLNNNNGINNNIVVGGRAGISLLNRVQNTQIVNNTVYGASDRELLIHGSTPTNVTIQNNIFQRTQSAGLVFISANTPGLKFSHNVWSGGTPGKAATGAGDIYADPQFVNPGGLTAADYQLKSTSPAVNAGLSLSTVTRDYFGDARTPLNGLHDIGADEIIQTKTLASSARLLQMDTNSAGTTGANSANNQNSGVRDSFSGQLLSSGQQSGSNALGTFGSNDGSTYGRSESIAPIGTSSAFVPTQLSQPESLTASLFYAGTHSSAQPKTNFQTTENLFSTENVLAAAAQNPVMIAA